MPFKLAALITLTLLCSGCFFYPLKELPITPTELGIAYDRIELTDSEEPTLVCWLIKSRLQPQTGAILYLHGNAQNNAYHLSNVAWLTERGFDVLMLDYRGFGESDGSPSVTGALNDIKRSAEYLRAQYITTPRFIFGQSIGAALALTFLSNAANAENFKAAIIESPFAGYRKIAREKIRVVPIFWPLLYPLTWFITDQESPNRISEAISIPTLLLHGSADLVVPVSHSHELHSLLGPNSIYKEVPDVGHLGVLTKREIRELVVNFISAGDPVRETVRPSP